MLVIRPSRTLRFRSLVFAAALAATSSADAKLADNCRRITIEGAAGAVTNVATWSIFDNAVPPVTLVQSCPIQPLSSETNLEYIRRLGHQWGSDPSCPLNTDLTEVSSRCLVNEGGTKSCRIKTKISPKTDGSKKRYVEFCCYADTGCGDKLVEPIPITVVIDRVGAPQSCPAENCVDNCSDCTVDVDPIGMRNLPTGFGATCRDAIARAVNSYTTGTTEALTACHAALLAGTIPVDTDCNSVSDDPTVAADVAALAPVVDAATTLCAEKRTPGQMGYGTCGEPCSSITINGWSDVSSCLRCKADSAAIETVESIFGPTAGAFPRSTRSSEQAQECQSAVAAAITSVTSVRARETADCQKKVDTGVPLPDGIASCADLDRKGRIEDALDSADARLGSSCSPAAIAELDLCSGATNADALAGCIGEATEELNETVVEAAVPGGDKCLACNETCGDGTVDLAEECDDGNAAASDGCAADCKVEANHLCSGSPSVCTRGLVRTGQTVCSDSGGATISCAGTGQDGDLQAGAARNYVDNGDGTITDKVTGLVWEKISSDSSVHSKNFSYDTTQAAAKIATLNSTSFAGYTDWRLPTVYELQTLVDFGRQSPAVSDPFHANCTAGCTVTTCSCTAMPYYLSSEPDAAVPANQWIVGSSQGDIRSFAASSGGFVRAVRGSAPPAKAFVDNGDGTITDKRTGLMWEVLTDDGTIHDKDNTYTWAQAFSMKLSSINAGLFAGYGDWRVPNVNEMQSLADYGVTGPALDPAFDRACTPACASPGCSCTNPGYYWTSTPDTYTGPTRAWIFGAATGDTKSQAKTTDSPVRVVRGGVAHVQECGDGLAEGAESCDGLDRRGATCIGQGFQFGSVGCTGACALDTTGCSSAAATDQDYPLANQAGGLEVNATNALSQTFTVGATGQLVRFDVTKVARFRCEPTDDLNVKLVTTSAGAPTSTVLASRAFKPSQVAPIGPFGNLAVDISSFGVMVTSGDVLAIVLESNAPNGGCDYAWNGDAPGSYAGGSCYINASQNAVRDMAFTTFVLQP